MRTLRRRVLIAAGIVLLAGLAMPQELRTTLMDAARRGLHAVQVFALPQGAQAEITLPEMNVYALQLGAYDSGERAQDELTRLGGEGTLCVIWQREQMRLVCDAAQRKGSLAAEAAQGHDAWVIEEKMPEVVLRVNADTAALEAVRELITLPDLLFAKLCTGGEELQQLTQQTREKASRALSEHPDHLLYAQLAQSLSNWCALIEEMQRAYGEARALCYARVTICTLSYELRQVLIEAGVQSAASTASAQRTPSTAADVMPPA